MSCGVIVSSSPSGMSDILDDRTSRTSVRSSVATKPPGCASVWLVAVSARKSAVNVRPSFAVTM